MEKCYIDKGCLCTDDESYPNIGAAFRGYDIVLGDPWNGADPGYKNPIFHENPQRNATVSFGNVAGHALNNCDGDIDSTFITNSAQLMDSSFSSSGSSSESSIGPEIKFRANIGIVKAKTKIPPIYQTATSNTNSFDKISTSLDSGKISLVKSTFSCYQYSFDILRYQHPSLTPSFKKAAKDLESCFRNENTGCLMLFFENFGTHYISKAVFGSKRIQTTTFTSSLKSNSDLAYKKKCARNAEGWNFLGRFGHHTSNSTCDSLAASQETLNRLGIQKETTVTIGSNSSFVNLCFFGYRLSTNDLPTLEVLRGNVCREFPNQQANYLWTFYTKTTIEAKAKRLKLIHGYHRLYTSKRLC